MTSPIWLTEIERDSIFAQAVDEFESYVVRHDKELAGIS
jgi:hypothetical protein